MNPLAPYPSMASLMSLHDGQSAAHVSDGCIVMGQGAGTAAAMLSESQTFADINVKALQQLLIKSGVYLDNQEE